MASIIRVNEKRRIGIIIVLFCILGVWAAAADEGVTPEAVTNPKILGYLYVLDGDYDSAYAAFMKSGAGKAEIYGYMGDGAMESRDIENAEKYYRLLVKQDTMNVEARFKLVNSIYLNKKEGSTEAALKELEKIREDNLSPESNERAKSMIEKIRQSQGRSSKLFEFKLSATALYSNNINEGTSLETVTIGSAQTAVDQKSKKMSDYKAAVVVNAAMNLIKIKEFSLRPSVTYTLNKHNKYTAGDNQGVSAGVDTTLNLEGFSLSVPVQASSKITENKIEDYSLKGGASVKLQVFNGAKIGAGGDYTMSHNYKTGIDGKIFGAHSSFELFDKSGNMLQITARADKEDYTSNDMDAVTGMVRAVTGISVFNLFNMTLSGTGTYKMMDQKAALFDKERKDLKTEGEGVIAVRPLKNFGISIGAKYSVNNSTIELYSNDAVSGYIQTEIGF